MSTPLGQTTTTTRTSYRTVNVSTDPAADSVFPANPVTYRTVNVSAEPQHVGPVTYRTVNLSPEPAAGSVRSVSPVTYRTVNQVSAEPQHLTYRTVNVSAEPQHMTYRTVNQVSAEPQHMAYRTVNQVSPLPYVNGSYENVRYLVPVQQQQQQFVMVPQMMQQMHQMSPLYLQTLPRVSVSSSQEEGDVLTRQIRVESTSGTSSVFSQSSSPMKSPEPSVEEEVEVDAVQEEEEEEEEEEQEEEDEVEVEVEEVEIINVIEQKPSVIQRVSRVEVRSEEVPQIMKMDTRFFGELLAEVYRKNCDIHSCISEHVAKIRGRKHQLDPSNDYKVEKDEVEYLLPKGASELTKQQIRYLLQTRLTADKSMRLLLSTFSSLREELIHMSEDLRRLESEKEGLERDLSFKSDQAQQYDRLLEAVRENNRQLQASLKDSAASQRTLENQLMSSRSSDSNRDFKMKELEGRMRALEKENEMLRQKSAGQFSSSTLQTKTEELSRQYNQQLSSMREEKDRELQILRSQLTRVQTEVTTDRSSSDKSLQLRISELLSMLEKRQTIITRQEEEIRKLQQERNDNSKSMTTTTITKRYRNKYPILGLLSDDYQASSRIKDAKTIVIEKTGDMIKQE